jgi:hypothetical protein
MSSAQDMSSAHAAVKHELLVRYLDAWTPAALHGHKRITYTNVAPDEESALAAARVFCEFADLLERHTLTMVLGGARAAVLERTAASVAQLAASTPGLVVQTAPGSLVAGLRDAHALGSPIFAWFERGSPQAASADAASADAAAAGTAASSAAASASSAEALSLVASNRASEVLLARAVGSPPDLRGLALRVQVELVDAAGTAELLVFATSSEKALEKFKDELWALDEYAGIRYRDPIDAEHTLLDISLRPNLRPLRRALATRVASLGESTVAALRTWAVHETIYRSGDATKAVQALVAAGAVERSPTSGRLSPGTVIRPAA